MKIIHVLPSLALLSIFPSFATEISAQVTEQVLLESAYFPEHAVELALAYPELAERIIANAQSNPAGKRIMARTAVYPEQLKAAIAKERSWRKYTCLELYNGQSVLRPETESPWPTICSAWLSADGDNPATTNAAQNEANGNASAYQDGTISYDQARDNIDTIIDSGSQIVDPLPPSGS